jgi:cysteine sulfinate desulfinase/cysteine desulfurase-like protein
MSVGRLTTETDIDYVLDQMPRVVADLRRMSPVYQTAHREKPA